MSLATALLPFTPNARARHPKARVWRPFPREVADIVGVEEHGGDLRLRMHPWFAISLVRSPAVVTVESRRDVVAPRHSAVLIPPFHLYGLRPVGEPGFANWSRIGLGNRAENELLVGLFEEFLK